MFAKHIADAIKTPSIVQLQSNLFVARFETMKVYSALEAVRRLLDTKRVQPGDTLLDSSSGIYAYALAIAAHRYGLKCHIIASKTVDPVLRAQLEILGATVEPVQNAETLKLDQERRVARIQEILKERRDIHWMQQYHDGIHYYGYREFAEEVVTSLNEAQVDLTDGITAVGGVGSGCSTGALKLYLEQSGIATDLLGVQPFGSVTFDATHIEDPEIIIAGIGSAIPFKNVRPELYNEIHWISFDYAASATVELLRQHAIFAGLSSGACFLVANWRAQSNPNKPHLFIAADQGHRYVSAVHSKHKSVLAFDGLHPREIASQRELALHWCAMPFSTQQHAMSV